jgi:fumarate reductase subunit D
MIWPIIVLLIWHVFVLGVALAKHGETVHPINFTSNLIVMVLVNFVLWYGGWFEALGH